MRVSVPLLFPNG